MDSRISQSNEVFGGPPKTARQRRALPGAAAGLAIVLLFAASAFGAPPVSRPRPANGEAARTLLAYTATRTAFTLENSLELVRAHLLRVAGQVDAVPIADVTEEKLLAADHVVVFCPQGEPALSSNLVSLIATSAVPVLWIGFGPEQLEATERFTSQFKITSSAATNTAATVYYRNRNWDAEITPLFTVELCSEPPVPVIMEAMESPGTTRRPLAWKSRHVTFLAAVPTGTGLFSHLFSDALLDFYGVSETTPPHLYFRIEGYECRGAHRNFRRRVDYLHSRGQPFLVTINPACGPEGANDLDGQSDFVQGLRYAQARGGRIVLTGDPTSNEFWDHDLDRPPVDAPPEAIRARLHRAVRACFKHGLFPLAWHTPRDAASQALYVEVAQIFSTAVERVQLSDASHHDRLTPSALTLDAAGRLIVPENLGYVPTGAAAKLGDIQKNALPLLQLRGTVAGAILHAYQPLTKFVSLVDALEDLHAPMLDLADLDHAVQIPDALLLTGRAERTVAVRGGAVRWRAFDRTGRLLQEDTQPLPATGTQTFKRRGLGDYELFEFTEIHE